MDRLRRRALAGCYIYYGDNGDIYGDYRARLMDKATADSIAASLSPLTDNERLDIVTEAELIAAALCR
jgi:hypothetical protein